MLAYTHLAPKEYEGKNYFALSCGAEITLIAGLTAASWVIAYLAWTVWRNRSESAISVSQRVGLVHPGERWVVLAHAVAFGSGYALGASNVSFLLVLAVHHEVQYLYFTYAMARHPASLQSGGKAGYQAPIKDLQAKSLNHDGRLLRNEAGHAASFLVWPVIGFAGSIVGGWSQLEWLAPLGMGGLFCHYWLDGRIWTRYRRALT
jgi:hypothetical protein